MAEPTEAVENTAKNVLSLLTEVGKKDAVKKLLEVSKSLGSGAFSLAGAVKGLIQAFLPDQQFIAIMHQFELLHKEIQQVRDDIKELEKTIKWESTKLQYAKVVSQIELAMELCKHIGCNKPDSATRKDYEERLVGLCGDESMLLAIRVLLSGITGDGEFRNSIFETFYEHSWGDRPKTAKIGGRLIQLVCGGLMAQMTFETIKRGKQGADEIAEMFRGRLDDVNRSVRAALDRCTDNFKANMQHDLETVVEENHTQSNKDIVHILSGKLSAKYDWLRLYCMVCDKKSIDEHALDGSRVEKLNYFDKCAIVFYVDGETPLKYAGRKEEVDSIVQSNDGQSNARHTFDHISRELEKRGIGWWGIACVKRYIGLEGHGTGAVRTWENGKHLTMCVLIK